MSLAKRIALAVLAACGMLALGVPALAIDKADVVGKWSLDENVSKAAPDGNTAGLMKELTIKDDGNFEAMYGTVGTWKIEGGKLLVSYANDFKKDRPGSMDGKTLKFPAPAMHDKFCYVTRVGGGGAVAAAAPAGKAAEPAKAPAAAGGAKIVNASYKAGDPVSVEWKGTWYPAKVLDTKDGKFQIHYDGFEASWDEWVANDRIKNK